jgi:hypothetical protein
MTPSRRRTLGFVATVVVLVVALLVIGVVASGGAPDVTRERVQHDLSISFANQWRLQQRILGRSAPASFTATTE